MPLDGNTRDFEKTTVARDTKVADPFVFLGAMSLVYVLLLGGGVAYIAWPHQFDYLSTLVTEGKAIADENWAVHTILTSPDLHRLQFTVAEHDYMVVTPGHPLTDLEKSQWFNFAVRHHNPVWTADGPLAVDP